MILVLSKHGSGTVDPVWSSSLSNPLALTQLELQDVRRLFDIFKNPYYYILDFLFRE